MAIHLCLAQIRPRDHAGITITDRYPAYSYKQHQYCLAHLKRDFKKFAARDGPDGDLGQKLLFELKEVFNACKLSCKTPMSQRLRYRKNKVKELLIDGILYGSKKFSNFTDRLLNQFDRLFFFTNRLGEVDCTNNEAERTLRHIVIYRKTSYGTQSREGSRFLERAVSIWMTLHRQGKDVLSFFERAYQATFHPQITPPLI